MERQYKAGMISVIMPSYNAAKYVEHALNSVFEQTYHDIEIVIVDDHSSDCTPELIQKYADIHPEICFIPLEKNMGAGYARNKALELAEGQYVAFLDCDDEWMPDKLERQLKCMKENETSFCYTAIEMIDETGKIIKGKRKVKTTCDYNDLLHNTMIATSSVVVDRKAAGDFRMHLRRGGQDYATWLKLLRNGTVACGINEVLVRYRVTSNSLSSNKLASIRQVWEIQTQDEKIHRVPAAFHVCCFVVNALKKYFI